MPSSAGPAMTDRYVLYCYIASCNPETSDVFGRGPSVFLPPSTCLSVRGSWNVISSWLACVTTMASALRFVQVYCRVLYVYYSNVECVYIIYY